MSVINEVLWYPVFRDALNRINIYVAADAANCPQTRASTDCINMVDMIATSVRPSLTNSTITKLFA